MSEGSEAATSAPPSEKEERYPAVAAYSPCSVTGMNEGEVKKWCTCGLSTDQPWCDGKHKGTGFHSLKWKVPVTQGRFTLCRCKHTKNPPYCDGTHCNLPLIVKERQEKCQKKDGHNADCKLCTNCGWIPDF